ncbi:sperm motility kinase X-like isoform X2 [Cricetulus griseus]|uniref:non-specific serine/threonine protein kinase n=1 Tax=Cricetulus griseus TaxID=10029 RepID=A0A9J7GTU0_CRIGR|nr:sperm motility kinase X-like isoform X2 [Cricetulus griseus]
MQLELQASSPEEVTLTDHYMILRTLGKGSFSEVKLACHLHTGVWVAIKVLERSEKNDSVIMTEIDIIKSLDHPNIIKLFHIIETRAHTYMVMEHAAGGDLVSHIEKVGCLQEEETQRIFTQMACAVNYCHENNIAHRDIKPDNILLDGKGSVKLCDFGLAIKVASGQRFKGFCGTLEYCAPEIFTDVEYDAQANDIWSMGVVLYTMVTGRFPFEAKTYSQMKEKMLHPKYSLPSMLSQSIVNLIVQLFTVNPEQRPKICDIMQHQWLKGSEELSKLESSSGTQPSKPTPSIVVAMWAMGYNAKDIRETLREKRFNSIMATYLILKHQLPWRDNRSHPMKPVCHNVAMTLVSPPTSRPFLKRTRSEPALHMFTFPAKHHLCDSAKLARKKGRKRCSMSDVPCCRQRRTLPPNTNPQLAPVAAQLVSSSLWETSMTPKGVSLGNTSSEGISSKKYLSYKAPQIVVTTENSFYTKNIYSGNNSREASWGVSTSGTYENKRSRSHEAASSKEKFSGAQPQGTNTASPRSRHQGWRGFKRRMGNCVQRLCCCLPARQTHQAFRKEVTPAEGEGKGVTQSQMLQKNLPEKMESLRRALRSEHTSVPGRWAGSPQEGSDHVTMDPLTPKEGSDHVTMDPLTSKEGSDHVTMDPHPQGGQ